MDKLYFTYIQNNLLNNYCNYVQLFCQKLIDQIFRKINLIRHFTLFFRPLSPEAIHYARSDTHYLLYVYDMIKKDLMAMSTTQCNYVELVFMRSIDVCKTVIKFIALNYCFFC